MSPRFIIMDNIIMNETPNGVFALAQTAICREMLYLSSRRWPPGDVERECFLEWTQCTLEEGNPGFAYYNNTGWDFSQLELREQLEHREHTR